MNRIALWSMGVVAGVAVSVGMYQFYGSQRQGTARAETATSEAPSSPVRSVEANARLQTELTSVKAQLAAIKTQLATRASAGEERSREIAEEELPTATPEQQRADDARAWKEHMAKVAQAFEAEALDPRWASVTGETVENAVLADPVISAAAGEVQCRSKTCRIEITMDTAGAVDKQLPLFVHGLGGTLPFGQADRIENSDGTISLALYLGTRAPDAPEPHAR